MKFHHLHNDSSEMPVAGIISSHSGYNDVKSNGRKLEEKHGLPRPPFINGGTLSTKQESLNGTTNNRDGIELQQKKVRHFPFN